MIIEVQGQRLQVPDGLSQDQIGEVVDHFIASQQPKKKTALQSLGETGSDFVEGWKQGATFGFGDELQSGIAAGTVGLANLFDDSGLTMGDAYDQALSDFRGERDLAKERSPIASTLGEIGGGITTGIYGAGTAPGQAIASRMGGGSGALGLLARSAKGAGVGAASAGLYGFGAADGSIPERLDTAGDYATSGAVIGGAVPVAAAAINATKRAATPAISEGKKQVAKLAQKYNIPLGIDDLTDSKFYKTMISEGESVPFSGSAKFYEKQQKAFTKAIAKSIGLDDVDALTPENMNKAFDKVGKQFDDLTKGKTFTINQDVADEIVEVMNVAESGGYGAEGQKILDRYLKDLGYGVKKTGQNFDISGIPVSDGRLTRDGISYSMDQAEKFLRDSGFEITRNLSKNKVGSSGYIEATIKNGRKYATIPLRISDHSTGVNRAFDYKHITKPDDLLDLPEIVNRAKKSIGLQSEDISDVVSGETLSKLRSKLNGIARRGSDVNAKALARDVENLISEFISGDAPEALQKAKYQYKNLIAIEPLAQKAQVDGAISPALLTGRVQHVYRRAFTKGEAGELGDLARIGQMIKSQVPNSGTSQRTLARNLLTGNIGAAAPIAFVPGGAPVAAATGGLSALAMMANRGLQARNYSPELIARALENVRPPPTAIRAPTSALARLAEQ